MTYDHWKTTPPDDWYGNPDEEQEDECPHVDYDLDILTGSAECCCCDHRWYVTDAQMKARERQRRDYDRYIRHEQSLWWRCLQAIRRWVAALRTKRNMHTVPDINDDIPF